MGGNTRLFFEGYKVAGGVYFREYNFNHKFNFYDPFITFVKKEKKTRKRLI